MNTKKPVCCEWIPCNHVLYGGGHIPWVSHNIKCMLTSFENLYIFMYQVMYSTNSIFHHQQFVIFKQKVLVNTRFQASATVYARSSGFWVITWCRLVCHWHFRTWCPRDQYVQEEKRFFLDILTLEGGTNLLSQYVGDKPTCVLQEPRIVKI